MNCTLCENAIVSKILSPRDGRHYYRCEACFLIFTHNKYYLNPSDEKARYDQHQNDIGQSGYVDFLNRVIKPALHFIKPGSTGLDYGCGPGPTISELLKREGIQCKNYDPFFSPVLDKQEYDFIFSTETFEHFHNPGKEIEKIISMIAPGGLLAIMTEFWESIEQFNSWYYKRDPTHVSFYHYSTFLYISNRFSLDILFSDNQRAIILQKNNS